MALLLEWLWQSSGAKNAPRDRFIIASEVRWDELEKLSLRAKRSNPIDAEVSTKAYGLLRRLRSSQ